MAPLKGELAGVSRTEGFAPPGLCLQFVRGKLPIVVEWSRRG